MQAPHADIRGPVRRPASQRIASQLGVGAGIVQVIATFCPAIRVRLWGGVSFLQVHAVGGVLLVLGGIVAIAAWRGWTRWLMGGSLLSMLIVVAMYFRIVTRPSGYFVDPLLRHVVHPGWGFVPMTVAILFALVSAVWLAFTPAVRAPLQDGARDARDARDAVNDPVALS